MARPDLKDVPFIKLAIWSLVIGLLLYVFNTTAEEFYTWLIETSVSVFEWLRDVLKDAFPYMLMGAAIVVPLWGLTRLWAYIRNKA